MTEGQQARAAQRKGREGNRWVNQRPSGEEVGNWFKENVEIDSSGEGEGGLDHESYVGGVTLIPNKEKSEELVGWTSSNAPVLETFYDLVYTPYMRVETRVKYFHDLCDLHGWLAVIEPAEIDRSAAKGLPDGFFRHRVATGPDQGFNFLGCTMRVAAYERQGLEVVKLIVDKRTGEERLVRRGNVVLEGIATKTVPTVGRGRSNEPYADVNAVMKAETGAVGRALGMAGILVIPGTGIATAEDLQESNRLTGEDAPAAEPTLPTDVPAEAATPSAAPSEIEPAVAAESQAQDEELRARATAMIEEMKGLPDNEQTFNEFRSWARSRGFVPLASAVSPGLRGLVRRAEAMLEEAKLEIARQNAKPAPAPAAEPTDPLEAP